MEKDLITITHYIFSYRTWCHFSFAYDVATAPKLDTEKLHIAYASQFYDIDGEQFADIGSETGIKIEYDDLPQVLIDAVTATEDARFFEHRGIDYKTTWRSNYCQYS